MAEEILYDMRTNKYPNKRGDTFRTLQVYKCPVCSSLTNRGHMGGYPGYGFRTICPNATEEWHHEIVDRMEFWGRNDTTVQSLLKANAHLVRNDLAGNPDLGQTDEVSSMRSWKQGQEDRRWKRRELYKQEKQDLLAQLRQLLQRERDDASRFLVPPGSYTRETLPPLTPEAAEILGRIKAHAEKLRRARSDQPEE